MGAELLRAYRKYARECLRFAGETTDPRSKMALINMAQSWAHLADQAEKNSRADLVYETPVSATGSQHNSSP
jgi:hypothetical protein